MFFSAENRDTVHSLPAGLILYFSDHRTNSVQYYSEVEQQFKGIRLPVIL